jgi:hypothetical protein
MIALKRSELFGVRWGGRSDTALDSQFVQIQSAVAASLCRRTPNLSDPHQSLRFLNRLL